MSEPRAVSAPADALLIRRSVGGDTAAFASLVDRHRPLVLRVARSITPHSAEEVSQQTFLSAWLALGRYDASRGSVASWLCGIARNRAIDVLRAESRRPQQAQMDEVVDRLVCPSESPDDALHRRMAAADVRRALGSLGPEQRTVLTLAYFGGLSQREIGERTGAPLGTVKGRARLGLDALRLQIGAAA